MGNKGPTSEIEARWQEEEEGETLYCQRHDWVTVGTFNDAQLLLLVGKMHTDTIFKAIYNHLRIRRPKDWKLDTLSVSRRSDPKLPLTRRYMYRLDPVMEGTQKRQGTQKRAEKCILVRAYNTPSVKWSKVAHIALLEALLELELKHLGLPGIGQVPGISRQ